MSNSVSGVVRNHNGLPIPAASVRLIGLQEQLGSVPGTVVAPAPGTISWTRKITDFSGHRWACWEKYLKDQIEGISWQQFMQQVLLYNPQLATDGNIFKAEKEYLIPQQASTIVWQRPITGFTGNRWNAWEKFVQGQVEGISWQSFMAEVVRQNPLLAQNRPIFRAEQTYYLPENIIGTNVVWTRRLTGFHGTRWNCWEQHIDNQITGISWPEFVEEVLKYNPVLGIDGNVFKANKQYLLPQNGNVPLYYLFTSTDKAGRYRFDNLPRAGAYDLVVKAANHIPHNGLVTVNRTIIYDVKVPQQATGQFKPVDPVVPAPPSIDKRPFIQTEGSRFIVNNRPFRFVGANIRGLIHYGHGAPLPYSRREHIDIQLQAAREMGARVVRVFGANRHASVNQIGSRLEEALKRVQAHDMYLIFAFTDVHHDTAFNVPGDDEFYQDNRLDKAWYEGGFRENYLPFVEQIVNRFKEHKRIFAWELGNELKARDGNHVLPELFIQFASAVSNRIRELDPIHLITTGVINSENLGCNNEQAERLYRLPNLDFMTAHVYHSQSPNQWLTLEAQRAERDAQRAQRLNMPFIIEEIGFQGGDRVEQTEQHLKKWLESKIAAGFMQWGLMATNQDMGDGDNNFGIHGNQADFKKIVTRFKRRAQAL